MVATIFVRRRVGMGSPYPGGLGPQSVGAAGAAPRMPAVAAPAPARPETDGLLAFIAAAPSPYHAVAAAAEALRAAGFEEVRADEPFAGTGGRYLAAGGALVAWWRPDGAGPDAGFRIVGAHTDSPNLRVKPQPDVATAGWRQLGVDVYGGALVNSWLDRDLGLSGRVVVRGAAGPEVRLLKVDRPLLRVPQLAIHLDREVNERGVVLDRQTQLRPVWGLGDTSPDGFRRFVAAEVCVDPRDVLAWDVMAHDLTPPARLGADAELIAAARLDNLSSCWSGLRGLLRAVDGGGNGRDGSARVAVLALFDHEEVGSDTATGASGPLLESVLERIVLGAGGSRDDWHRALARSSCVSADMAHAVHPNYLDRYEPGHHVLPNRGPAVKVNVNQRYATDAPSSALFLDACERAGVPYQVYSHRSNLPCGSTIGPITATRLGIATVDVGNPQLSMHSARELAGGDDTEHLVGALEAYFSG